MASKSAKVSNSGLVFQLHPLALINISDHFVRIRANGLAQGSGRVYGCLLGQQNGREVSISNSFELKIIDGMEGPDIDEAFLIKKQDQYKQTFAHLDVVGWYSTGSQAEPSDMVLHKKIIALNESPAFLLLDTDVSHQHKELPLGLFESEVQNVDGSPTTIFVAADYVIQTSEAERIGVNQVARVLPSGNDSGSEQLIAHYSSLHAAIKMLSGRIASLHTTLTQMVEGQIPMDHGLMREAASLLQRLPLVDSEKFVAHSTTEFNDALLMVLMSSLTKGSNQMLEYVEKINLAYSRP